MTESNALCFGSSVGTDCIVREAIDRADPLPGTGGFAGAVDDTLVRDVLGRVPLYVERAVTTHESEPPTEFDTATPDSGSVASSQWSHSPRALEEPVPFPAGCVGPPTGPEPVWELPHPPPSTDPDALLADLSGTIREVTESQAIDATAVAFSGGIDSALLAAFLDVPLYVVGFPDSHDVEAARSAATAMGRTADLRIRELSLDAVERAVPSVATEVGRTNAMDVAIGTSMYLVADAAARDGIERLVLGQGADELFGGYEKVARLDHRVEAETVRGAVREQLRTLSSQLPRDVLAVEAAGVEPVMPYLHDDVIVRALELPTDLLVSDSTRKVGLRRIARAHLPETVAGRDKKALQYGSLVSRELDRLARRAGYKRRMDDHVGRYVESRLE